MAGNRKLLSIAVRSAQLTSLQFLFYSTLEKNPRDRENIVDADVCLLSSGFGGRTLVLINKSGVSAQQTCVRASQQRHCSFSCSSGIALCLQGAPTVCVTGWKSWFEPLCVCPVGPCVLSVLSLSQGGLDDWRETLLTFNSFTVHSLLLPAPSDSYWIYFLSAGPESHK